MNLRRPPFASLGLDPRYMQHLTRCLDYGPGQRLSSQALYELLGKQAVLIAQQAHERVPLFGPGRLGTECQLVLLESRAVVLARVAEACSSGGAAVDSSEVYISMAESLGAAVAPALVQEKGHGLEGTDLPEDPLDSAGSELLFSALQQAQQMQQETGQKVKEPETHVEALAIIPPLDDCPNAAQSFAASLHEAADILASGKGLSATLAWSRGFTPAMVALALESLHEELRAPLEAAESVLDPTASMELATPAPILPPHAPLPFPSEPESGQLDSSQELCPATTPHNSLATLALDLCIVMDCTSSMRPYAAEVLERVELIVEAVRETRPDTFIRMAFVGYTDYEGVDASGASTRCFLARGMIAPQRLAKPSAFRLHAGAC